MVTFGMIYLLAGVVHLWCSRDMLIKSIMFRNHIRKISSWGRVALMLTGSLEWKNTVTCDKWQLIDTCRIMQSSTLLYAVGCGLCSGSNHWPTYINYYESLRCSSFIQQLMLCNLEANNESEKSELDKIWHRALKSPNGTKKLKQVWLFT